MDVIYQSQENLMYKNLGTWWTMEILSMKGCVNVYEVKASEERSSQVDCYSQGSFCAANWLILANFDPNFVIPEISVNQVRKDLACMLGGSGRPFFMTACPALIYFAQVRFSRIFARPE